MQPKTVIFIGPQGSGKGTQAKLLCEHLEAADPDAGVASLETGKYFRDMMESGTYTGERIKALLDDGQMIPDFFAKHIVIEDLAPKLTATTHLILDGFPRNENQVEFLDRLMSFYLRPQLSVVFLNVPEEVVRERLSGRGRFDDTETLIQERLSYYRENTLPLVEHYRNRDDVAFVELDGTKSIEAVTSDMMTALGM